MSALGGKADVARKCRYVSTWYHRTRNFGAYGHAESEKTQKFASARHCDQIRFRFRTTDINASRATVLKRQLE